MQFTSRRTFIKQTFTCAGMAISAGLAGAETKKDMSSRMACAVPGYIYKIPAMKKESLTLFQGDSITDMNRGRNYSDMNHYLGHSYPYLIASRLGIDVPELGLKFLNRGISGNTVADLKKRWQTDTLDLTPDYLSILIGTNDVGRNVSPDQFESDYRSILDDTKKTLPNIKLILLDPFVLPVGKVKDNWEQRYSATQKMISVVGSISRDYGAIHICTQDIFNEAATTVDPSHWIWDGVHPLPQGHELIARNWIQTVAEELS